MKANIRMAAESIGAGADQDIELELPARALVTVTAPGWNTHVSIEVGNDGRVAISGMDRVPITPNSTRKLEGS